MSLLILTNDIDRALPRILASRADMDQKNDGSFVSAGDIIVQDIIIRWAEEYYKEHRIISEELPESHDTELQQSLNCIVVDPIDGTENFISGLKEWGIGISIFTDGQHESSMIYLPELNEILLTGMKMTFFNSRVIGLSSSTSKADLISILGESSLPEVRITGCSMYNFFLVVRGSFKKFYNMQGANCWDVLPGCNLALEFGCEVLVNGEKYIGQLLLPGIKYRIEVGNGRT